MLTTRRASGELGSRPVEARPDRGHDCLYFLTDARSAKEHEIEADAHLGLVFVDASAKAYISLTARGSISRDIKKAQQLWQQADSLWWSGPEDPNLVVLRADLLTGEIWDGPSFNAVELYEFLKAKITGAEPNLGQNRKSTANFKT
jgi:general stress protein 26